MGLSLLMSSNETWNMLWSATGFSLFLSANTHGIFQHAESNVAISSYLWWQFQHTVYHNKLWIKSNCVFRYKRPRFGQISRLSCAPHRHGFNFLLLIWAPTSCAPPHSLKSWRQPCRTQCCFSFWFHGAGWWKWGQLSLVTFLSESAIISPFENSDLVRAGIIFLYYRSYLPLDFVWTTHDIMCQQGV